MDRTVIGISANSAAEAAGIVPGDVLLTVNDEKIKDIFDYLKTG